MTITSMLLKYIAIAVLSIVALFLSMIVIVGLIGTIKAVADIVKDMLRDGVND